MTDPMRGNEPPLISRPANTEAHIETDVARNLGPLITSTEEPNPLLDIPATAGTAASLAEQAQKLADEVASLRESADKLSQRAKRNEWAVRLTAIGLALDIALSIFAFMLLNNQSASNVRLEASIREQCSLYALVIGSYSDASKQKSPLGPADYDSAFQRIQASADHLACGIPHRI